MTRLTAQGYELLPPGRYVLEVVDAEPIDEYGPQLRIRNRVAQGEYSDFEFTDYPNHGIKDGVKMNTKAWDLFEACLNKRLAPDEELDTEDLIGTKFEAMVVVKKTSKGNRIEHGTIGPYRKKSLEAKEPPETINLDDADNEEFKDIPI